MLPFPIKSDAPANVTFANFPELLDYFVRLIGGSLDALIEPGALDKHQKCEALFKTRLHACFGLLENGTPPQILDSLPFHFSWIIL